MTQALLSNAGSPKRYRTIITSIYIPVLFVFIIIMAPLLVQTTFGPIVGFEDTYSFSSKSNAGKTENGGHAPVRKWLAVPYGQAKRFERPTDPEKWTEPKECFEYGTIFPQLRQQPYTSPLERTWTLESENSHTLDIYAPVIEPGEKVPVMVYIYGGGFDDGCTSILWTDPTETIRANAAEGHKMIWVLMNYRTACLGFLSHPDLVAVQGQSGNYGLYDQIKAFQWVKANIAAFGGDPDNITASGESAGSTSVSILSCSGLNLFRRAIMQSGTALTIPFKAVEDAYSSYDAMIEKFAPDCKTPEERIARLRSVPARELVDFHYSKGLYYSKPTVETFMKDACWPLSPHTLLSTRGVDSSIDALIMGTNEDEGTLFVRGHDHTDPTQIDELASEYAPFPGVVERIKEHYITSRGALGTTVRDAPAALFFADEVFVQPTFFKALAVSSKTKTYMYRLSQTVKKLRYIEPDNEDLGTPHTVDIPLSFRSTFLLEGEEELKASDLIRRNWVHFATNGTPLDEAWKPFTPESQTWLRFEDGAKTVSEDVSTYRLKERELWLEVFEKFGKHSERVSQ